LPKTASTTLQEEVFPALVRHTYIAKPTTKILHPTPRGDSGLLFERALSREPGIWAAIGGDLFDEFLGKEAGERPVLVSDESIGRAASDPLRLAAHLAEIDRLARARGFAALRVMVVIREQAAWLASHFAQLSDRRWHSDQAAFERFVRKQTDPADGLFRFGALLQYDRLHMALTSALAPDRVGVLALEELERDTASFFFKLRCLLHERLPELGTKPQKSRNVRNTGDANWMLRSPPIGSPVRRMRFMLRGPTGRTIKLTPELRRACMVYAPGNAALAERTGLDLAGYGYAVDASA
jgi:hypothetical protein